MAGQSEAEDSVGGIVQDVAGEDGVRRVQVEVVHKTETNSQATVWTIALVCILTLAVAGWFMVGGKEVSLDGGSQSAGTCGNGLDDDNGGQADRDDPDCYENPEVWKGYNPNRSETNGANDGPGRP